MTCSMPRSNIGYSGFRIEKAEKVYFSVVVVVLCDMEIQSTSTPMNSRGQGHSVHC